MKPITNWEDIPMSTEKSRLAADGYVITITEVKDEPAKEYLSITYDIAEGPEKGRYSDDWGKEHPYAHRFIRSYKETAKGMFKSFIGAVEASNKGFDWLKANWNEAKLVGKLVGIVLGEEEYESDRGETKTRLYVRTVTSADAIREGRYTVPELKKLAKKADFSPAPDVTFGAPAADEDLPF